MAISKITKPSTPIEEVDKINELVDGVNNAGTVKKVNNTSPDNNGNVTISIPSAVTESTVSGWGFTKNAGTVTSVNNISPTNGNVTLSIPAAQVQSNWNETSTSSKAYIQNKPTIPTVNNATLTITQGGTTKGTFTANASSDVTIALDAGGSGTTEYVRNIGEIVTSTIPLTDAELHLLDGALISSSGIYGDFVTYISGLVSNYPDLFVSESDWQTSVTTYGVCGKFVYNSTNNTVRLPKITGIVEGTTDLTTLGDLVEAGLPNITGFIGCIHDTSAKTGGAFSYTKTGNSGGGIDTTDSTNGKINFNASRSAATSAQANGIYRDNCYTVQPQTIKVLYYIVVATTTKTDIEVDIDNIATELNTCLDTKRYDGQWVGITGVLLYDGNSRTSDLAIDISSYIPNDNYNYEILVWAYTTTGATSGNTATCAVNSDIITDEVRICQCRTRTSSSVTSSGNAIIPIHNRAITIVGLSSNTGSTYLNLVGYRRIGTNS